MAFELRSPQAEGTRKNLTCSGGIAGRKLPAYAGSLSARDLQGAKEVCSEECVGLLGQQ